MEIYWRPCYRYVMRRFQRVHEEAQDLVQSFFAAVMEQGILSRYDSRRGPFRPYLRACLDRFILKEIERNQAEKRGGRARLVSLDTEAILPATSETPEQIFHREWQRQMFTLATEDLRRSCEDTGRTVRFRIFTAYDLADEPRPQYEALAAEYGLPVSTVTNHLAWARRELRRLLEFRLNTLAGSEGERQRELLTLLTRVAE